MLRRWRDLALNAPESVSPEIVLWNMPPDPAVPGTMHGANVLLSAGIYAGDPANGDAVLRPFPRVGELVVDLSGTVPSLAVQ